MINNFDLISKQNEKMKKILMLVLMILSINAFSQNDSTKISGYISTGFSLTNSESTMTSVVPCIESGIVYKNISLGFASGIFKDIRLNTIDKINFSYEVKTCIGFTMCNINGSFILGYGGYSNLQNKFIEYGVGISHAKHNLTYGVSYSNIDNTIYLSPSLTFNF